MWRPAAALIQHRFALVAAWDSVVWCAAILFALLLRYEFDLPAHALSDAWPVFPIVAAAQLLAGGVQGIYLGRWRFGSFEEVAALLKSVLLADLALLAIDLTNRMVPLSVTIIAPLIAVLLMSGARYGWRLAIDRQKRPADDATRLLVFGVGDGGVQIITSMMRTPESPYLPVGLIDDNPRKQRLRIMGVPVLGTRAALADAAERTGAEALLIAVPSGDSALMRELSQLGVDAGLQVKVLPTVGELLDGEIGLGDIRPLTEADLLGRHEIDTDLGSIAGYLTGKRVLVTGAGGSIGSELCRQIHRFAPASLTMLDRDESALHAVQLSIDGRALLDTPDLVVCDIRDDDRLRDLFAQHEPEVVFHAAALKHLPLLEMHPSEAVKTNIWGTQHLLAIAEASGVTTFVNISTDKAADPCSVLGYSKRITERLTSYADKTARGTFMSVRFGNVLGSRGSVLTTFRAQIASGGPVTVTHPEVTRYFMTIEEAVQLVVQAGAIGDGGDVLVLDMGEPVRIDDVAHRLVEQAERHVDIVYTGLRQAEKLNEVLLGEGELDDRRLHPLISHVSVPPLPSDALDALDLRSHASTITSMRALSADGADAWSQH